jgi:hypothetical protein
MLCSYKGEAGQRLASVGFMLAMIESKGSLSQLSIVSHLKTCGIKMNREERAINPGAQHLFNYHKNIGWEAGYDRGMFVGIFVGGFGMLAILFLLGAII